MAMQAVLPGDTRYLECDICRQKFSERWTGPPHIYNLHVEGATSWIVHEECLVSATSFVDSVRKHKQRDEARGYK